MTTRLPRRLLRLPALPLVVAPAIRRLLPRALVVLPALRRLLALPLALALVAPAAAEPVALDGFLAGFEAGCGQSEAWVEMRRRLVTPDLGLAGEVSAPGEIAAAFGAPVIVARDRDEGTVTVEVPVRDATFRGLRVAKLRLGFARDYPLVDDSVIFAAAGDTVLAAFADDLAAFARDNPESIVEYMLFDDADGPRLSCFATN